jgi:hypothetical protein
MLNVVPGWRQSDNDVFRPLPWVASGIVRAEMRVDDTILKTVVFLGREVRGTFIPYGTGFLAYTVLDNQRGWQNLITARHVIDSIRSPIVHARLNNHSGEARIIPIPKSDWFFHPDDQVDVAVAPTIMRSDMFDMSHFTLGPHSSAEIPDVALTKEVIARDRIGIGDETYTAGMFVGRLGERQNIPILRLGTIASMPGELIQTSYGFHEAFLLEVRSIDGLSGSPTCIHMPVGRRMSSPFLMNGPLPAADGQLRLQFYLMGMVLGYNEVYGPTDKINIASQSKRQTTRARRVNVPLNTGIAVVLPIWKILEAINQPTIQEARMRAMNAPGDRNFVPTSASGPLQVSSPRRRRPLAT